MRHTVKAVFDHRSDAQHVLDELLASGYSRADTALSSAPPAGQAGAGPDAASGEHAEGLSASLKHTLARLFSSRQHKPEAAYADGFMPGRHTVTLTTDSDPDARRAVDIIERFGPLGIEDLPDEQDQGIAGAGMLDAGAGASGMRPVYPPGTEPGALQHRAHEEGRYFGTQNAQSPPTGNTFEETMGGVSQWDYPDLGAPGVRTPVPWPEPDSGSRDDEPAAYLYGKEMRTSDKYRNRSWDEVEPDLKRGWEDRDAGAAAWDGARVAVRRGWDSTSPDIDDDSYYRTHWNARYANSAGSGRYDEHAAAYLYGNAARRNEQYRNRDWKDVEPDLRADWEARHAGQHASWETFKDAVNHGWNRIGPDAGSDTGDDHLAAAYRHGSEAARDSSNRGRHWSDVEARLRSEWERRRAGTASPAWNKVKEAVRRGWDRVRS